MAQHIIRGTVRSAKNTMYGYNDIQVKVRECTSNDPWGPSGSQMAELSRYTHKRAEFRVLVEMLWKRLNDSGRNWRHVFKALTVLQYLLLSGAERVVSYTRDNIYVIRTLSDFQFVDDDGRDQGANVREKARALVDLLNDDARLKDEREKRQDMQKRMSHGSSSGARERSVSMDGASSRRQTTDSRQLERAIRESKEEYSRRNHEDEQLKLAIELSKKEEEERKKRVEADSARALFGDSPSPDASEQAMLPPAPQSAPVTNKPAASNNVFDLLASIETPMASSHVEPQPQPNVGNHVLQPSVGGMQHQQPQQQQFGGMQNFGMMMQPQQQHQQQHIAANNPFQSAYTTSSVVNNMPQQQQSYNPLQQQQQQQHFQQQQQIQQQQHNHQQGHQQQLGVGVPRAFGQGMPSQQHQHDPFTMQPAQQTTGAFQYQNPHHAVPSMEAVQALTTRKAEEHHKENNAFSDLNPFA